jgi:hypothetical protein
VGVLGVGGVPGAGVPGEVLGSWEGVPGEVLGSWEGVPGEVLGSWEVVPGRRTLMLRSMPRSSNFRKLDMISSVPVYALFTRVYKIDLPGAIHYE